MFGTNDFMNYKGYRNMVVEEKIEECMREVRRGVKHISMDCDDLTESEARYVEKEVKRRVRNGRY